MPTRLRILLAITAAPWLLAPNCNQSADATGEDQTCQEAIDYLENQCGIASGAGSGACDAHETCVATCILDASCDALSGADSAAAEDYNRCADGCDDDTGSGGSGGSPEPNCSPCGDYLDGAATFDEVCASGQELLNAWSTCICSGPCEVACFEHCQGFDPNLVCSECVSESCAAETQACQYDH